jgi:hypothetical protein
VAGSQPTTWTFSATDSKITFDQNTKKVKIDYLINIGNYSYTISVKNANYQTFTKTIPVSVAKGNIKITSTDWNLSYTVNRPVDTIGGAPDAKTITHSAYGSTTIAYKASNFGSNPFATPSVADSHTGNWLTGTYTPNKYGKFKISANFVPGNYWFTVILENSNYYTTEKTYSFTVYKETPRIIIRWSNMDDTTWRWTTEYGIFCYSGSSGYFHFQVLDGLGREVHVRDGEYSIIGSMWHEWISGDHDLNFGYDNNSDGGRYKCSYSYTYFKSRSYQYSFYININEGRDYSSARVAFTVHAKPN